MIHLLINCFIFFMYFIHFLLCTHLIPFPFEPDLNHFFKNFIVFFFQYFIFLSARQRHAVGAWGTGSRTCMLPTIGYRGSAHGSVQVACMRCTGSTHAAHRQREGGAQAAQRRAQTVGRPIQAGRMTSG